VVLRDRALAHCQSLVGQGVLASAGMIELGRLTMMHGTSAQQATFVHIATNSIQYHWRTDASDNSSLQQLQLHCAQCDDTMSFTNLTTYPAISSIDWQRELRNANAAVLSSLAQSRACASVNADASTLTFQLLSFLHRIMKQTLMPSCVIRRCALSALSLRVRRVLLRDISGSSILQRVAACS
jgi:hypothetical protein